MKYWRHFCLAVMGRKLVCGNEGKFFGDVEKESDNMDNIL